MKCGRINGSTERAASPCARVSLRCALRETPTPAEMAAWRARWCGDRFIFDIASLLSPKGVTTVVDARVKSAADVNFSCWGDFSRSSRSKVSTRCRIERTRCMQGLVRTLFQYIPSGGWGNSKLNPCRAPKPLPILIPSHFTPETGFQLLRR